jgi:phenylacetate-coenzyme A ligase PaaK-like adenylate-forming protein
VLTTASIVRTFLDLNRAQWLSTEELRRRAEARLALLLAHATKNVPFYRQLGLTRPALGSLPVMDKSIYRSQPPETFIASNVPPYRRIERATSGSTGVPYRFFVDRATLPSAGRVRPSWR